MPLMYLKRDIDKARDGLLKAQVDICQDRMNCTKIEEVKMCAEKLICLNELEESVLKQRVKINWLRLRDGNNYYFHASINSKVMFCSMCMLSKDDGTKVTNQANNEEMILAHYGDLMGTRDPDLLSIDIKAMRNGAQVYME